MDAVAAAAVANRAGKHFRARAPAVKAGPWPLSRMATAQSYDNHPHQPTLTIVATVFVLVAIAAFALRWFGIGGRAAMAAGLGSLILCNLVLITISRVYTTKLQDRIIRLEMRVRAGGCLTPEQQRTLAGVTIKQMAALRFASDAELPALLERAARERLSPDDIKRAVKDWQADLDRT